MGLFNKKNSGYESIYANNILYNPTNKVIVIKNGFSKKEILINEVIDFGIAYGISFYNSESVRCGKEKDGGLEKYFSGYYDVNEIPPISIFVRLNNNKIAFYPLTISKTKKGRTLIVAEQIFDKLNNIING